MTLERVPRRHAWTILAAALLGACGAIPAADRASAPSPPFNDVSSAGTDCWAKLYEHKNMRGRSLTVVGPARIAELPRNLGFPWDPRYESLVVGPAAVVTLYDEPDLRDRKATFSADVTVWDLDREMGLFRTVRSLAVACPHVNHARRK